MIKFRFLAENKTENPACNAEHGLSIFIETEEKRILFDTGASDMFAENAEKCHVDLTTVQDLVISHGHYDHTEGVPRFCQINKSAPVYIHKDAFGECYGQVNGKIDTTPCSLFWTEEERKALAPRLSLTDGPLWLTDNIVISGTIPEVPENVVTEQFFEKKPDGTFVTDPMNHEQFLAIRNGDKGIVIFSGCSHKGVIPVLAYTKELFPGEKISVLVAGMHLYSSTDAVRKRVVEKILAEQPDVVMPVHCTGIDAICMVKTALGDRCVVATVGNRYEY